MRWDIDFRQSSKSIIRLVNALKYPYPNASIEINGKFIKVKDCKLKKPGRRNYENLEPGRILKTDYHMNLIDVKCNDALLRIELDNIEKKISKKVFAYEKILIISPHPDDEIIGVGDLVKI